MRRYVLVALAALATACGGSTTTGTTGTYPTTPVTPGGNTPVATTSVILKNVAFTPPSIEVGSGAVVTFTNNDGIQHNVTFANLSIGGTGNFSSGDKTVTMPSTAGAYTYECTLHTGMTGTVTVK